MLFVVVIASGLICEAQERTARIVETLADDQFIVEIGGVEYRAINGNKAVELAKQKVELQACSANEARYQQLLEIGKRDVIIAEQQRDIERGNFVRVMALYEKERELRTEVMSQTFSHGKAKGLAGWLFKAIDSPYFQFATRVVAPVKALVTK